MRFENVRKIKVKAINGLISLEVWENDYADVSYVPHGEVDVEVEQSGGRLLVREKPKTKKVLGIFPKSSEGWAEISLKVPKSAIVNARNVNGELKAKGVRFGKVTTVNGEIHLEDCKAEKLSTVNGEITAHLSVAGPLRASTVNGELEITIEELEGDVEASCVNGDIVLRLTDFCDARIETKKANGDVEFVGVEPDDPVIGTGEFTVKVSTVNGDVRIELI
ncbi:DUF4097 family beta strand repeat-containing protein [Thermococcus sp.]|uniref:DUF4097 family beta strand repeat-containing protein n=1 Tax=Thermococcus sp. TaxID=35749 RepID=UPI0026056FF7|nr:DUF4097 family beta strand repeat-containing protein [Thermococcus sp.]